MSTDQQAVTVNILDKEYTVACSEEERASLMESVEYLDSKIKEVRSNGSVVGNERIVVMTALNIVHEFLQNRDNQQGSSAVVEDTLQRVHEKITVALAGQK